jgi:DNA-binding LacI/PurR family transcriptional regulator
MFHRPQSKGKKVTQKAVAKESGVSQTLVSLVLSKAAAPEQVAESTRKRILDAAEKLGYAFKKNIVRGKAFALIMPVVTREDRLDSTIYEAIEDFYARTQCYIAEAAYRKGYSLVVRPYEQSNELTHWLSEWGVDGVLWQASDENLIRWISGKFPMVQLHYSSAFDSDAVTVNQEEIPIIALNYLYQRGHRSICFLPGQGQIGEVSKMRVHGFRKQAEALDLPIIENFLKETEPTTAGETVNECLRLLDAPVGERPTAFVCGDPLALVLARKIQERGLLVPQDISLIGIDNLSAGALYNPPLTSIDVCQREVSETAVAMLTARIANPGIRHQKVFISPTILERGSVADISGKSAPHTRPRSKTFH